MGRGNDSSHTHCIAPNGVKLNTFPTGVMSTRGTQVPTLSNILSQSDAKGNEYVESQIQCQLHS